MNLTPNLLDAIRHLLCSSWRDIEFNYLGLTDNEKECITKEEFDILAKWVEPVDGIDRIK